MPASIPQIALAGLARDKITPQRGGVPSPRRTIGGEEIVEGPPQAEGGEYLVQKPTTFLAGEAGPEIAKFTSVQKFQQQERAQQGPVTVTFDFSNSKFGSDVSPEEFGDRAGRAFLEKVRTSGPMRDRFGDTVVSVLKSRGAA